MEPLIILLGGIIVYGMIVIIAKGIFDEVWKDSSEFNRDLFAIFWWLLLITSIVTICCLGIFTVTNKITQECLNGICGIIKIAYNMGRKIGKGIKAFHEQIKNI